MTLETNDEKGLLQKMQSLSHLEVAVFCACCAERIMPCYDRFATKTISKSNHEHVFRRALNLVWDVIFSHSGAFGELTALENECLKAMPNEDEAWSAGEPYSEDAAAIVVFALQAIIKEEYSVAIHTSRRMYEVLDNFINASIEGNGYLSEMEVSSHPLVQRELQRQDECMAQLRQRAALGIGETAIFSKMRTEAAEQSKSVFTS